MEKLVSRSLMLILIGMATAQNIQAGERMSMPTSFKKQTTGLSHVSQQTISVKGNVRDQSGEPMAGVNVIVEGTTIGTMTDSNGNFTLNVPSTSIKIKFSYIGYACPHTFAPPCRWRRTPHPSGLLPESDSRCPASRNHRSHRAADRR